MKVKVTPRDGKGNPIPGAGSWEEEVVVREKDGGGYELQSAALVPASWCEPIPEVVPEEGDICLYHEGSDQEYIDIFVDCGEMREPVKVLARKPKGWGDEVIAAIVDFNRECASTELQSEIKAAYERFLSAILGVPYARVDR